MCGRQRKKQKRRGFAHNISTRSQTSTSSNGGYICYTSWDMANFVLKFPNFRHHSNKGRLGIKLNSITKTRTQIFETETTTRALVVLYVLLFIDFVNISLSRSLTGHAWVARVWVHYINSTRWIGSCTPCRLTCNRNWFYSLPVYRGTQNNRLSQQQLSLLSTLYYGTTCKEV